MNKKAREFYAWLNACPFKIWKIEWDAYGKTTVSFIWDEHEDENTIPDKYQSITSDNADYFEQGK